jgi:hypothetical protein
MSGDTCNSPCGTGKVQDGTSTACRSCPAGTVPNFGRSYCVLAEASGCSARPTQSTAAFDCPSGWTRVPPGSTIGETGRCITNILASTTATCAAAWDLLGKSYNAATVDGQAWLVCGCLGDEDGAVLKQRAAGRWECAKEAVFLPNGGVGAVNTDSPIIQATTVGIWYDLLPGRKCTGAQACWDMCFFADGRPRYHASFTAATQQTTLQKTRVQAENGCNNPGETCQLKSAVDDAASSKFFEACRRWGTGTMWHGSQHTSLRALYTNAAEANSWHTEGSCGRIWPFRPMVTSSTNNLNLYGLQSQAAAKCSDCWGKSKAELLDAALVRYGNTL